MLGKDGTKFKLARIGKHGDKLEFVCKFDEYPVDINEKEPDYCS